MSKFRRRGFMGLVAGAAGTALFSRKAFGADRFVDDPARSSKRSGRIPVLAQTDVLVVGSGPAGLAAALASAREGATTMLVERYGFFGGNIAQNMMGTITWYRHANTVDAGGILRELELRAKEMGGTVDWHGSFRGTPMERVLENNGLLANGRPTFEILNTEIFKYVADVMLLEAGVKPLLHSYAADAIMEGNAITGIVTESKSGRQSILAKRVVDATGDADIACMAGAPFRKGPKNELMEVTLNFSCSGIDIKKFRAYQALNGGKVGTAAVLNMSFEKAKAAGEFPPEVDVREYHATFAPGETPPAVVIRAYPSALTPDGELQSVNAVHMFNVDPTDVMELTRAEIEGRKLTMMAMTALKKYAPGFASARLRNTGTSLGVRESRRILGRCTLTGHDVKNQVRFDDSVGICPEFVDGYGVISVPKTGRFFQVPYGIMLPQEIDNLVVAGRCVAGDRLSHATIRQMVCCVLTGQAAGVAAAAAIKQGRSFRQVDVADLQARLKRQRVRIG